MFSSLIQIVGIIPIQALAGGLAAALLVAIRGSSVSTPIHRVRSSLFKVAAGSFVLVIVMTLIEFMVRAMNESP